MVTPAISYWQPGQLWHGLRFDDIVPTAKKYVEIIEEREHPDLLVGLFHSGYENGLVVEPSCHDNSVKMVAEQVPGFDLICYGHDHIPAMHHVRNCEGGDVVVMGPTCKDGSIAEADIFLTIKDGRVISKRIEARIAKIQDVASVPTDKAHDFSQQFIDQQENVRKWGQKPLCVVTRPLVERQSLVGPCLFMDFIHQMQISMTGAEVSLAASFGMEAQIDSGVVTVADLFPLLKYEEFIYSMRLTGEEIQKFLELSYGKWTNQMHSGDNHVLQMVHRRHLKEKARHFLLGLVPFRHSSSTLPPDYLLKYPPFDLYSAAGLEYTIDVTKPVGHRVCILRMADGNPFCMTREYSVAMSRYVICGG